MKKHVCKLTHDNGEKLKLYTAWCGHKINPSFEWHFQDAQHVALAVDGSIAPCKKCIKAIIKDLEKEL